MITQVNGMLNLLLPVLLASSSEKALSTPICQVGCVSDQEACGCGHLSREAKESQVPGCTLHWAPADTAHHPDTSSMVPAIVTLNGVQIGYPVDGTTPTTSCDQIAAICVDGGLVRGTSHLVSTGFAMGIIGTAGEMLEFRYWNAAEEKEYLADFRYEMKAGGQLGSFAAGKAFNLVLSEAPVREQVLSKEPVREQVLSEAPARSQLGTWGTLAAAVLLLCIVCSRRIGRSSAKTPDHQV